MAKEFWVKRVLLSKSKEPAVMPDLESIVARQVSRYIQLGFHTQLGESEDEYRAEFALPKDIKQPESYKGRFDVLLVVDPRIHTVIQNRIAHISQFGINIDEIINLTEFPSNVPYAVWTHNGKKYSYYSVEKVLKLLADDELGSPVLEVTALYLQHSEYFKGVGVRGVYAAGSRYERNRIPALLKVGNDKTYPYWSTALHQSHAGSRGKEIIRLGIKYIK